MKVLWLTNIILPNVAVKLGKQPSNKEGWLSGIADAVKKSHDFELAIAFPLDLENAPYKECFDGIIYYGFFEDTTHPEVYSTYLEDALKAIVDDYDPDVIHIFGTEFPHTLAMTRVMKDNPQKILVGIQGVMDVYANHYLDGVPKKVVSRRTFRDRLKKDSLLEQYDKFLKRSENEVEALKNINNVTGRTPFDREFAARINPAADYHFMNETLRPEFYEGAWNIDQCEPHSIFLSQANYPIKGFHFFLEALPKLVEKYPDIKVYVAGDNVTKHKSVLEKIKLASYDKYLVDLMKKYKLEEAVIFTGNLDANGVKERLLKTHLFVCPSTIENSPNSLGEAMLLGVPSIAANVGGIPGIFTDNSDGLLFERGDIDGMIKAVEKIFDDDSLALKFSKHASMHAQITHNPRANYERLLSIYNQLAGK